MAIIAKKLTAKKITARSPSANGGPVEAVKANIMTYSPDGTGLVNLGSVVKTINNSYPDNDGNFNVSSGGGGSVNAVSINGDTKNPDTQGLVALGDGYLQADSAYGYVSVAWSDIEAYVDNLKFSVAGPLSINITGTPEDGRFYVLDFAGKLCGSIILGPTAYPAIPVEAIEILGFIGELITIRNIYTRSFRASNCSMIDTSSFKLAQPTSNYPFVMLENSKMTLNANDTTFPASLGSLEYYLFDLDYFSSLSIEGTVPYTTTANHKYVNLEASSRFSCSTWAGFDATNLRALDNTSTCVIGNVQLAPAVPGIVNGVKIDGDTKGLDGNGIIDLGSGFVKNVQIGDELFQSSGDSINLSGGVSRKVKVNGVEYSPDNTTSITDIGGLAKIDSAGLSYSFTWDQVASGAITTLLPDIWIGSTPNLTITGTPSATTNYNVRLPLFYNSRTGGYAQFYDSSNEAKKAVQFDGSFCGTMIIRTLTTNQLLFAQGWGAPYTYIAGTTFIEPTSNINYWYIANTAGFVMVGGATFPVGTLHVQGLAQARKGCRFHYAAAIPQQFQNVQPGVKYLQVYEGACITIKNEWAIDASNIDNTDGSGTVIVAGKQIIPTFATPDPSK